MQGSTKQGSTEHRKPVVLIVEDNQFFLKMQRIMLERAGFAVLAANNGVQGLELFRQLADEIDVVVTDLMMPGVNGLEVCRRIREQSPKMPMVLVTGAGEDIAPEEGGFDAAMRKPFEPSDLIQVIRHLASSVPREERRRRIVHGE